EFVHQDLALIETLSVLENLRIADLATPSRQGWYLRWRRMRREATELFERYGLTLDPSAKVGDLDPVEKALVAILRAIEAVRQRVATRHDDHSGLLVLDEPTVFL